MLCDSDVQEACVDELGTGFLISAADTVYVAFRQDVFEKELETGLQKDVLLQVNINDLWSSLSSFPLLVCPVHRVLLPDLSNNLFPCDMTS